jgi:uncharacterized protein (TIGR03083 family)
LAALRRSQDRLVALVDEGAPPLTGPSYCRDWTVAQVFSHLGSGAEIFALLLDAGLSGGEPPGRDAFPPIWDAWNARPPGEQARDSISANRTLIERFESLDATELAQLRVPFFGSEVDAAEIGRMRLSEHAIHTWDIAVMADPAATVATDAIALIVDNLGPLVERSGQASSPPVRVRVETTEPDRQLTLAINESVEISDAASDDAEASIGLPAEALVRLVYGRLDPAHTPNGITAVGVDLDRLRRTFPGF